jgi:hypothetical protein
MTNPFADIFSGAAQQFSLDPNWLTALGQVESSFNPNAISSAGALGVMQLMPRTGASVGVTDFFDPQQNIYGGAKYFSQLLDRSGGDYWTATKWYNCGPGNTCPAGVAEANKVQGIAQSNGSNPTDCGWNIFCQLDKLTPNGIGNLGNSGKSGVIDNWVSRGSIIILGLILLAGAVYLYGRGSIPSLNGG